MRDTKSSEIGPNGVTNDADCGRLGFVNEIGQVVGCGLY